MDTPDIPTQINAVLRRLCHHCGAPDDPDGDHTCPCPYPDHTCPHHPPAPASHTT
jgi:hypothetical protein